MAEQDGVVPGGRVPPPAPTPAPEDLHPVPEGLALVARGLAGVLTGAGSAALGAEARRAALVSLASLRSTAEAAHLALLRAEVDDRTVTDGRGAEAAQRQTGHWLARAAGVGLGRARADVANAALTDPDRGELRRLGQALREGHVTREHVDVARATLKQVPRHLRTEHAERIDELLTDHARQFCPADAKGLGQHLVRTVAPDREARYDPATFERRSLAVHRDPTGAVHLRGQLDEVGGAYVATVLHHLAAPGSGTSGRAAGTDDGPDRAPGAPADTRAPHERMADGMVQMARLAVAQLCATAAEGQGPDGVRVLVHAAEASHPPPAAPPRGRRFLPRDPACDLGLPVQDLVATEQSEEPEPELDREREPDWGGGAFRPDPHTDLDAGADEAVGAAGLPVVPTCEATGPLSTGAFQVLLCDAAMDRVVFDAGSGRVVRLETAGRYATRAMRRALAARDRGCAFPDCTAPPSWCDAHHVVWWSRGGRTVLANLVLLCGHHHTVVHQEEWSIVVRDGVPWFRPPDWLDPAQPLLRNRHRQARIDTEALARRIAEDAAADAAERAASQRSWPWRT